MLGKIIATMVCGGFGMALILFGFTVSVRDCGPEALLPIAGAFCIYVSWLLVSEENVRTSGGKGQ